MRKGFAPIIALLVILLVVGGVYLGLMKVWQNQIANPVYSPSPSPDLSHVVNISPTTAPGIMDWKTYVNSKYKYSFKYPSPLEVIECEGGGVFIVKTIRQYDPCHSEPVGDFVNVAPGGSTTLPDYIYRDYKITNTTSILDGKTVVKYLVGESIGVHPSYLPEYILVYTYKGNTYWIYGGTELDQILSTFKFN